EPIAHRRTLGGLRGPPRADGRHPHRIPQPTSRATRNTRSGAAGPRIRVVPAAGAVLYRMDGTSPRVAVVHRPRYDDWSLPKGKVDPGESLPVTAVREIEEGAGFTSVLQAPPRNHAHPAEAKPRE